MLTSNTLRIRRTALFLAGQLLLLLPLTNLMFGQTQPSTVPRLVKFSGTVNSAHESLRSAVVGLTFALYKDEHGGVPLWLETQNAALDASGHYIVQLGATLPNGLPQELFASGEARWLGVQPEGQAEQPRVLLLSVPYALKAGDAETLGGLPLSAFLLAAPPAASPGAGARASAIPGTLAAPLNAAVTGAGAVNFIPLWDTTSDIVNSVLSQTGTGTTAKIGINTVAPTSTLDVKGAGTIRGALNLPATGTATATAGKTSQPLNLTASAFSSGTGVAANQTFRLQTEPAANNSATPGGKLNLLFYSGANAAAETGLSIGGNGQITFAPGQSFPGTGNGTITGVTAGSGLVGGGTTGNISLSLPTTCAANQILKWNGSAWACSADGNSGGTIKGVTAGTALTGGGTTGIVTLNLDTTKVPQLNTANLFTTDQGVTGNLTASGIVTGGTVVSNTSFNLGTHAIAFGSYTNFDAFMGFAGNFAITGLDNTATGVLALGSTTSGGSNTANGAAALTHNTTGDSNTANGMSALVNSTTGSENSAVGIAALYSNTTGNFNTAIGDNALVNNTTGSYNSALGRLSGPDSTTPGLTNSTAIGARADVTEDNALVLGSIKGVNGATADTFVGIGTTAPAAKLDVHGTGNFAGLVTFASGQTFPGTGTITGVTAGTALTGGGSSGGVTLNVDTTKLVTGITAGTDLTGGGTGGVQILNLDTTKVPLLAAANTFIGNQTVNANLIATAVGIGTASPLAPLHIDHLPATGGQDVLLITSGRSSDVASLLIQNTAPGGRLRAGAGTDASYLASSGAMRLIAGDTGTPSHPGSPNITIDTAGHVGIATTVPAFTLDVNGTANFRGAVNFASSQTFPGAAQLNAANTFTGNQMVNGNVSATGLVTGSAFDIGGTLFAFGSAANLNAFLGFAGNTAVTGTDNTGIGGAALAALTVGQGNTAIGQLALGRNHDGDQNTATGQGALAFMVSGSENTAIGANALQATDGGLSNTGIGEFSLFHNTSGSFNVGIGSGTGYTRDESWMTGAGNTFLGTSATSGTGTVNNATAIGAFSEVDESNAIVLGSIIGFNNATSNVNVGIGTTTPAYRLHVGTSVKGLRVEGPGTFTGAPQLAASFGGYGDFSIDGPSCPGCRFIVKDFGSAAAVQVGIGTSVPDAMLTVLGSADKLGGGSWGTYSDGRLKNLHGYFSAGLKELLQLQPIRYVYRPENGMGIHDPVEHIGFVAQEVQRVIPEAVTENNKGYLMVNNDPILWTMLNAIKEQQREITILRKQLQKEAVTNARLACRLKRVEDSRLVPRHAAQRTPMPSTSAHNDSNSR